MLDPYAWATLNHQGLVARTGAPLNTLLARKHYAVKQLRRRLQGTYEEWFGD